VRVLKEDGPRHRNVRLIALFLLSTGARLNEALRARWGDIDRGNRVWRIPALNSKSKRVRSVPLNASAVEVLDRLDTEDSHECLFVNARTGRRYTSIHKVWRQLRAMAGLPHLRIHDLRHQYASFLVNSGRTLYEVQQILGHSDPSVTQRYAHLSRRSLQDAADSADDVISKAMRRTA
jgi:integrase